RNSLDTGRLPAKAPCLATPSHPTMLRRTVIAVPVAAHADPGKSRQERGASIMESTASTGGAYGVQVLIAGRQKH
ncbi:hypothetical protein, partial [Escherichia coli]|uniref:hypothetical protein n=1 Tax=Escherichia coli TaxID=562 RepID=UPI001BDBADCE